MTKRFMMTMFHPDCVSLLKVTTTATDKAVKRQP